LELASGLQTTAPIQNEMVSELEGRKPRIVVLESDWDNVKEPNGSARSGGVTILDDYIRVHYETVSTLAMARSFSANC
jgi:hypothetical protein